MVRKQAAEEMVPSEDQGIVGVNEVRLVGRVSRAPEARELPSGDLVVQLRVVVGRPPSNRKTQVDTIDVACWTAAARRSALRQHQGDVVEVSGALRRRFYRVGPATQSRYEVEAETVRRHLGGR
jgi:single-strand DNA-binding protein